MPVFQMIVLKPENSVVYPVFSQVFAYSISPTTHSTKKKFCGLAV